MDRKGGSPFLSPLVLGIASIPKQGGLEVQNLACKKPDGPFWANPAFWFFLFNFLAAPVLKKARPPFLSRSLFLHCHWRDASIPSSNYFRSTTLFGVLFLAAQNSDKIRTKVQTKIQTKFRQNWDKIQTSSDKIQTCLNLPKHYKTRGI